MWTRGHMWSGAPVARRTETFSCRELWVNRDILKSPNQFTVVSSMYLYTLILRVYIPIKLLGGIYWFDYWVWSWSWLSFPLIIRQTTEMIGSMIWFNDQVIWHNHLIISDSSMWKRLQNHGLLTNKTKLYESSSSVNTPLSSQVGSLVLIPDFIVFSWVLSIVLFLRVSGCFPDFSTRSVRMKTPGPDF